MRVGRKNLILIALYGAAALILAVLAVAEFGQSRFDACMSVGAFSKTQCEEYARE